MGNGQMYMDILLHSFILENDLNLDTLHCDNGMFGKCVRDVTCVRSDADIKEVPSKQQKNREEQD